jgi:putative membrane protein
MLAFHEGKPHTWHELARAWSFEPLVIIALSVSGLLFAIGVLRLWHESPKRNAIKPWEVLCFAGGWLALFVALVSPLHAWGSVLFSAHMTQHEILMLVAAPLFVLGRLLPFLWALPLNWSRTTWLPRKTTIDSSYLACTCHPAGCVGGTRYRVMDLAYPYVV